jgi:hypothetical protein
MSKPYGVAPDDGCVLRPCATPSASTTKEWVRGTVGDEQCSAIRAERDLRGVAACAERPRGALNGNEPVVFEHEPGDVRIVARIEDVHAPAVHRDTPRRRPSRWSSVENTHVSAVDREQRHVVAAGIGHEEAVVVRHDRAL